MFVLEVLKGVLSAARYTVDAMAKAITAIGESIIDLGLALKIAARVIASKALTAAEAVCLIFSTFVL